MLYNTPDTLFHRTAVRLKRQAAPLIEEAKKVEESLRFSDQRLGKTLDMNDLEPIEGWEYSVDPWPGRAVRELSPLSSMADEDVELLEKEIQAHRKELQNGTSRATDNGKSRSRTRSRALRR